MTTRPHPSPRTWTRDGTCAAAAVGIPRASGRMRTFNQYRHDPGDCR